LFSLDFPKPTKPQENYVFLLFSVSLLDDMMIG